MKRIRSVGSRFFTCFVTDSYYDSPPKNQRFSLTNISWLLATRKDTTDNRESIYFVVCKSLSINDVGVSRDTVFQAIRSGAGFETGDFVKETLGGHRRTVLVDLKFRLLQYLKVEVWTSAENQRDADLTRLTACVDGALVYIGFWSLFNEPA